MRPSPPSPPLPPNSLFFPPTPLILLPPSSEASKMRARSSIRQNAARGERGGSRFAKAPRREKGRGRGGLHLRPCARVGWRGRALRREGRGGPRTKGTLSRRGRGRKWVTPEGKKGGEGEGREGERDGGKGGEEDASLFPLSSPPSLNFLSS